MAEEENLPHTAAATWSGFIYQGRIALYHVLKLLHEKTEQELDGLYLQIDSIEDFTIMSYSANNEVMPSTIHQVKAVKSNYYSTYEADFKQLEGKRGKIAAQDVVAYFHFATQNEKTKIEIEALHPALKIYCYENDAEFCSLENIDKKIKTKIAEVLKKRTKNGYDNEDALGVLYDMSEKIISDKLIEIHSLNHRGTSIREAAYDNTIRLNDFLSAITQDVAAIIQNESYFEGKVRNDLNRYYQDYCFEADRADFTQEIKDKLNAYLFLFNSFDSKSFKSFLQNVRPHKEITYTNLTGYKDGSLVEDEVKDAFFKILEEVKKFNSKNGIGWTCAELKNYFPTTITHSDTEAGKTNASKRILKTALSTNVEVPFNADYLVTAECNVDNIAHQANKIINIDAQDQEIINDDEQNKHIVKWKKVGLIDLETAKNKLK